jgi:hypothetical protein
MSSHQRAPCYSDILGSWEPAALATVTDRGLSSSGVHALVGLSRRIVGSGIDSLRGDVMVVTVL